MTTPTLLPCPFCGGNDLSFRTEMEGDDYRTVIECTDYVVCGNCGAQGPPVGSTEMLWEDTAAAAAWNQCSAGGSCPELKNLVTAIDAQCLPEIQDQYFTVELCNAIDAARAAIGNPPASAWQHPKEGTKMTDNEFNALCDAHGFSAVARGELPLVPRNLLKALVDAAVLAERELSAWQPIETAPRDGTEILAWDGIGMKFAWRYEDRWIYDIEMESPYLTLWHPTHWQPLPSTPPVTP